MKANFINSINNNRTKLHEVIPLDTPYVIYIDVCSLCNFKCMFCAPHSSSQKSIFNRQIMSFDTYKKVIDDLAKFPNRLKKINLCCHGEPLINNRLPQMVDYARKKNVADSIGLATNGSLLNKNMADELINAGLQDLKISVEAIDEAGYERIAGYKINYEEFIENIRYYYENKNDENKLSIKILDIAVDTDDKKSKYLEQYGNICDRIDIENVVPLWPDFSELDDRIDLQRKFGLMNQKQMNLDVCPYPFHTIVVMADGKITACSADWEGKLSFGNIQQDDISEVWNGDEFRKFRIDMLKNQSCEYCKKCGFKNTVCNDQIDDYKDIILERLQRI